MRPIILLLALLSANWTYGQPNAGLIAYYSFDDCSANDQSGNGSNGSIVGNPICDCGVFGNALELNGIDDRILFLGTVNNNFNRRDFTISLYIKPTDLLGTKDLLSKRQACDENNALALRFSPASNFISGVVAENSSKTASVGSSLDFGRCWQHIVLMREGNRSSLYINGVLRQQSTAASRIDLTNNEVLSIGDGPCSGVTDTRYGGFIDEIRIYDRALDNDELASLYLAPDRILNPDTTLFLGSAINIRTTESCADNFSWSPVTDISDSTDPMATITPSQAGLFDYTLSFNDGRCIAFDTIQLTVIDPNSLDCQTVFLPNAFTPNGDNRNDTYGISNPFAVQNLLSLEIFDRWGGRVFFTTDPFEAWDGSFQGEPVNPGVMLYRVRYVCDGEEQSDVGSLTIIR
ncbi:MAG: LamG-like jellyroll fold domain-containing protein [Bacteroidota bacterium]